MLNFCPLCFWAVLKNQIHYAIANDHYVIELTISSMSTAIFNIVTDVATPTVETKSGARAASCFYHTYT